MGRRRGRDGERKRKGEAEGAGEGEGGFRRLISVLSVSPAFSVTPLPPARPPASQPPRRLRDRQGQSTYALSRYVMRSLKP